MCNNNTAKLTLTSTSDNQKLCFRKENFVLNVKYDRGSSEEDRKLISFYTHSHFAAPGTSVQAEISLGARNAEACHR